MSILSVQKLQLIMLGIIFQLVHLNQIIAKSIVKNISESDIDVLYPTIVKNDNV